MPGLATIMSLPLEKSLMRIITPLAPLAPVTRVSPLVMQTASTLPAAKASMEGTYSNQENSTSTPASLKKPLRSATSQATQPGQSL